MFIKSFILKKKILVSSLVLSFMFVGCGGTPSETVQPSLTDKPDVAPANQTKKEPYTGSTDLKIFSIGDSTMNNSDKTKVGWGQRLGQYLIHPDNYENCAHGGKSSTTYRQRPDWLAKGQETKLWWTGAKDLMKKSDLTLGAYLLIQFGHNDSVTNYSHGGRDSTLPGRNNTFYNALKVYVDEARDLGVTPVLMTPTEYIKNDKSQFHNIPGTGDYAQTVRDLAADENVLLLDMQKKSYDIYNSAKYTDLTTLRNDFADVSDVRYDEAHFSLSGANIAASWVKEMACESRDATLCGQFK